jgi:hypothetical protein
MQANLVIPGPAHTVGLAVGMPASAMRVRSTGRPVGGDMGVFRHRSCLAHALPRCAHIGM